MIHVLYGEDEFTLQESLLSMKEDVGPAELRDVNISELNGPRVTFDELQATCDTVPFLAEKRMVIVEGLLSLFEAGGRSAAGSRGAPPRERPLGMWAAMPEYLPSVPPTTELVFVEGRLRDSNTLFARIRAIVQVRRFPTPNGRELREWIRQRAAKRGVDIEHRAVDALAETIGADLRVLDMELQKLALYRWEETVRHRDVDELVSYVKEVNIFAAVDAVIEGRMGRAITLMEQLLDSGRAPSYLVAMIARQVRLLLLAKDLIAQGVSPAEIGKRLSITGYPLRKTLEQQGRFTIQRLAGIHRKLLEADLSIKRGATDEQLALEMLIAGLARGA